MFPGGYYAPAEDGSMVDPYGHVIKQTGPNEFLYAIEHTFRFQDGRYYCDLCEYSILKRCRMLLHIRLKHMDPQQNEGSNSATLNRHELKLKVKHMFM